jgi:hypothetical protein
MATTPPAVLIQFKLAPFAGLGSLLGIVLWYASTAAITFHVQQPHNAGRPAIFH